MAKAVVDPAELRRFAQDLKRFNGNVQGMLAALHGRFNDLSQSWRDQEHMKFAEEFEATVKVLSRFSDSAEKHIPFLLRKAEKIEEYLNQR